MKGRMARSLISIISRVLSTTTMSSCMVFHFLWGLRPIRTVSTTLMGKLSLDVYGM